MAEAVLDASALLAVLNNEPGADVVLNALADAIISAVNYAEVVSKLLERGVTPILMREALDNTNVKVVAFGADLAERTGLLRLQTRHLGLSLGDRACLALAEREGIPALTADRSWIGALSGIDIRAIR